MENKVHVHDLHATVLRLMGFDHEKLTYRYAGRRAEKEVEWKSEPSPG